MLLVNDCESTKFEQSSFSMHYSIKKMQVEEQTVQALIRLLLQEQSDLGLHCLLRPICPNILNFYSENINCLCFKGITIFYLQFISIFIFFFRGGGGGGGGGRMLRRCWVNFQCRGILLFWIIVGQGPIALALGAGGGVFGHFFSRLSFLSSFSLSLGDSPI